MVAYDIAELDDLQGVLFDLENDPWEVENLWARRSCRKERERLLGRS